MQCAGVPAGTVYCSWHTCTSTRAVSLHKTATSHHNIITTLSVQYAHNSVLTAIGGVCQAGFDFRHGDQQTQGRIAYKQLRTPFCTQQ